MYAGASSGAGPELSFACGSQRLRPMLFLQENQRHIEKQESSMPVVERRRILRRLFELQAENAATPGYPVDRT